MNICTSCRKQNVCAYKEAFAVVAIAADKANTTIDKPADFIYITARCNEFDDYFGYKLSSLPQL